MFSTQAKTAIYDHALCSPCSTKHKCTYSIKKPVCALCLESQGNHERDEFMLCSTCENNVIAKGINTEKVLIPVLNLLPKIFYDLKDFNLSIKTKTSNMYEIDCLISFTLKNYRCHVIIEKDEKQHASYEWQAEIKKLADQTRFVIGGNSLPANTKIFVIRYNPNSKYNADERVTKEEIKNEYERVSKQYSPVDRLIILRQWLVWYVQNIESVRSCIVAYMWYDKMRKNLLFANGWEGFGMVYHRPAAPSPTSDWKYALVPNEVMDKPYRRIVESSHDPALEFRWLKVHEQSRLPPEL